MKEGVIVYLVGGEEVPDNLDLKGWCQQSGLEADRVELVGASQGFFDVEDAWYHLWTRGCGRINLLVARWQQRLCPVHPPVRLCG